MLVRDVMSTTVLTAKPSDSVRSVVLIMLNHHCGAVPVVDDSGHMIGIVSLRDVLMPLYPEYGEYVHGEFHDANFLEMEKSYPKVLEMKAEDVMTRNPITISPDEPCLKAASFMGVKNLRRIPVVEKNELIGIVSIADINRGFFTLH